MILVTGASGFVGRYVLQELFQHEQSVVVLTRDANTYQRIGSEIVIEADLDNCLELELELNGYGITTCIHLAWVGLPEYNYENSMRSLEQGLKLLELCKEIGVSHVIMAGTCFEYNRPQGCISTEFPVCDSDYYKVSKNALRKAASLFCRENGISFHWLRFFYVFGIGQRETSLIPTIVRCIRNNEPLAIRNYGNRNDFVYVKDVAFAIWKVVQANPEQEILNVGSGMSLSVAEVVCTVAAVLGKKVDIEEKQNDEVIDFYADAEEMMRSYMWKPSYTLEDALREMLL